MRNLIYAINITLDGCCDHNAIYPDNEIMEYYTDLMRQVGLNVYGRKTYELMVPYWPDVANDPSATKSDRDFAEAFNSVQQVVFSRTLDSVDDGNTRIVRTNLRDEILRLKQESGKPILVGGVDVAAQILQLGLVDEVRLGVAPVIAGEGRR